MQKALFHARMRAVIAIGAAIGLGFAINGAQAQTLASPSDGCNMANAGAYDFSLPAGEPLAASPFSGTFEAGERLTFTLTTNGAVERGFAEDTTAGATILDSLMPASATYSVPAGGLRDFNLELDTNDFAGDIAVTCAPAQGSITIRKDSGGEADVFEFTGDIGSFQLDTSGGVASQTFSGLNAGVYSVIETANASFTLADLSCTGDDDNGSTLNPATGEALIDLDGDENIVCTYTNAAIPTTGSITVRKDSGGVPGIFDFTGDLGAFQLDTSGVAVSQTFANLAAGAYTVSETPVAGFTLEQVSCTGDVDNGTVADVGAARAVIDLDAGEDIVCTFTNAAVAADGDITIRVDAGDGDGSFDFEGDLDGFTLTTDGGVAGMGFDPLDAGRYSVQYIANPDFELTGITCTGDADAGTAVDVEAGSADIDLDDNESIVCTFFLAAAITGPTPQDIIDTSQQTIRNFLYRRANALLSEEPDRPRLLRKSPGVLWDGGIDGLYVNADENGGDADFAASAGGLWGNTFDIWAEGHYTWYEYDYGADLDGRFGVIYLGADYFLSKNVIVGVLGQFDWTDESAPGLGQELDGHGWMVGPYASARLSDGLFFDARAAWGGSTNEMTIDGIVANDTFETDRFLVRGNLTGNQQFGDWRVTPSASVAYYEEDQHEYLSNTGVIIGAQSVSLGRATFSPEIARRYVTPKGTLIEPQLVIEGIWDFDTPAGITVAGLGPTTDEFRVRVEGALMVAWKNGYALRAAGSFDGIGASGFEAYGARLWLDIPIGGRR